MSGPATIVLATTALALAMTALAGKNADEMTELTSVPRAPTQTSTRP
jgi:hypothetical protein